jgi:hypothetical protein
MIANPDLKSEFQTDSNPDFKQIQIRISNRFKSGFQTDSNPDLTKNCGLDWNPDFRFRSVFKPD